MQITRDMLDVEHGTMPAQGQEHDTATITLKPRTSTILGQRAIRLVSTKNLHHGPEGPGWLASFNYPDDKADYNSAYGVYRHEDLEDALQELARDLTNWSGASYIADILTAAETADNHDSLSTLVTHLEESVYSDVHAMRGRWQLTWRRLTDRIEAVEIAARLQGLL